MDTANNNNDSAWIPEWILREQADAEREANRRKGELARQALASMAVATKGPESWDRFVGELDRNLRGIERLGINGRASFFAANNNTPDHHCRVLVSNLGPLPRVFYRDLFYRPGSDAVRSRAMDGTETKFQLTSNDDGSIGIMLDRFGSSLDMKEAACRIVQDAKKRVS